MKKLLLATGLTLTLPLAACGNDATDTTDATSTDTHGASTTSNASSPAPEHTSASPAHAQGHHHHADGGPAPEGIAPASDPAYPVGTAVRLTADHMPGMKGAEATVSGAYSTYAYAVTYAPTPEGTEHKWVVQEEIEGAGDNRLPDGAEVRLTADHMPGMEGARATVDFSTDETVYMVDYESGGEPMKNHKWVVESEMEPLS
ncbi:YdhK family protein [Corynebacterium mastitidis]|uniref:YdhK family protein n=1 Tax=Corynebacterium mastitidis TaxID=161890 RepID=A0ABU8NY88_9CORY